MFFLESFPRNVGAARRSVRDGMLACAEMQL